ncbi:serine-threonine protein kinase [Mycolicibacterium farcinogenes]|uniref:serine-threonine protein kinase n=1 Tax=Mycolicibacterium farcinogenes TaxID=1802 RepID=UPI001C8DB5E8|nr:serine-threonine protein kinase [Mycolicibacterium farcinogenes]QZH59659.1 serine-threonine protein kinase [Mycolicibacterium farcinogenes]
MTDNVAERTWRLVFDADGDPDPVVLADLKDRIGAAGLTDLVMFSHGWNNDEAAATSLYGRWFGLLAPQLDPARAVGFVGVRWPSQLWRDEPIPDFSAPAAHDGGGAAALGDEAAPVPAGPATIDPAQLAELKDMFPHGKEQLDRVAGLLAAPPNTDRLPELLDALREFSAATQTGFNDGEADAPDAGPGMLAPDQDPEKLFTTFADELSSAGVRFDDTDGGAAGLGDIAGRLWHGAKEALRQLSYWKMKNRAGVVGRRGLGPVIDQLHADFPDLRIHLVGHSFGARVVSYAIAGISDVQPSPVKAVTLLQGAYSRFTFTERLPFRKGAGELTGLLNRIDGPLTVCFSSHDRALGTFYPLASAAAGEDAAAVEDPLFRWRAMGSHGAYQSQTQVLGDAGASYPFQPGQILNLDSSGVVSKDEGPSGAHSDIFHEELTWVAAAAGRLNPA